MRYVIRARARAMRLLKLAFQILIHAYTRFAHPTVVNSHSSICCICRMSCIFHFESYFYYMSCDHTPLLRIHIF